MNRETDEQDKIGVDKILDKHPLVVTSLCAERIIFVDASR